MRRTLEQRLWSRIDQDGPIPPDRPDLGSCWLWVGPLSIGGRYAAITVGAKSVPVHRLLYTWRIGPIPDGLELDHLCRNTRCVRPSHLEAVTHRENMRRGRGWAGENARKTACSRHGLALIETRRGRLCR